MSGAHARQYRTRVAEFALWTLSALCRYDGPTRGRHRAPG